MRLVGTSIKNITEYVEVSNEGDFEIGMKSVVANVQST